MAQIVLDDWQKEFMDHKGHSICCTGRRVGKTYIHARKAVKRMLEKPNTKVVVASLTEDQAMLILFFALNYLDKNYHSKVKRKSTYTNSRKITLSNGSTMTARAVGNTGDSIRGFEGDVLILDEVSRFNELILEAATPILLTTGGEIWACSTPFGKQGWFWRSFQNKDNRFKVFYISTEEVIKNRPLSPEWTQEKKDAAIKFLEEEKIDKSELQYGQEYMGLFLDELRRFYSDEWIELVCKLSRPDTTPKKDNYMGVDIARLGGDSSTYEILHSPRDRNSITTQIAHHIEDHKLTTHTEQRIISLTEKYACEKVGIDMGSGSLGVGIGDHLLEIPKIANKIVAMNNRTIATDRQGNNTQRIMNEDYHDNLRSMGEHGEILLLKDDDIKQSFRNIQIEIVSRPGTMTKVRIYGKDSHIVEGIKRAAYLAKKEKSKNISIFGI